MSQVTSTVRTKFFQSAALALIAAFILIIGSIATGYIYIQTQQARYPNAVDTPFCSSQIPHFLRTFQSGVFTLWTITGSCTATPDSPTQVIAWFNSQKPVNSITSISTSESVRYHEVFGAEPIKLHIMHLLTTTTINSQTHIFITTSYQLQLGIRQQNP
jgi:hypothetical protein